MNIKKLLILVFFIAKAFLSFGQDKNSIVQYKNLDSVTVWGNKIKIHKISNSRKSVPNNHLVSEAANHRKNHFFFSEVALPDTPFQLQHIKIKIAKLEEKVTAFLIIAQKDVVFYRKEIDNSMISNKYAIIDLQHIKLNDVEATLQIGIEFKSETGSSFRQKIFMSDKSTFQSYVGKIITENEQVKLVSIVDVSKQLIPKIQFELVSSPEIAIQD